MGICFFIGHREAGDELLPTLTEAVERHITDLVLSVPGVSQPHHLRTRRIGNRYAIDVHIRMDGNMPLSEAHDRATQVEQKLRDTYGKDTYINI